MAAWPQKFEHAATALPANVPASPPEPLLGAPAMPDEPPAVAPPATPVPVETPGGVLLLPPLGVGCMVLVEPLTPVEPLGSELPRLGSSSPVSVEVRPPQPAIATRHKAPNQTRAPENDTAISRI